MNTANINLRVSDELKDQIEELGFEQNRSISEVTRSIIEEYFNEDNIDENEDFKVLQSIEVLKLIIWIYDKRIDPNNFKNKSELSGFVFTIFSIKNSVDFSNELKLEFDKILRDVKRVINSDDIFTGYFNFPLEDNNYSFDFKLLEDFINEKGMETYFV